MISFTKFTALFLLGSAAPMVLGQTYTVTDGCIVGTLNGPQTVAACVAEGLTCCTGAQACLWPPSEVKMCANSCNGPAACVTATQVGPGSCNDHSACRDYSGTVGAGSCNGDSACRFASGPVADGSCIGFNACSNTQGSVGSGSCTSGSRICSGASTIGDCVESCSEGSVCPDDDVLSYNPSSNQCEEHSGSVDMDPHFQDWMGHFWDFHGVCDMLFLRSKQFLQGLGLEIQIRTKRRYEYSYIESAVVKIGQDILEVFSFGDYMLNGVTSANLDHAYLGSGLWKVTHTSPNKKKHIFNIAAAAEDNSKGEQIILTTYKDFVGVHLKSAGLANFGDSVGLMGNYTTGAKLARDGITLMDNDPLAFGQEWQMLQSEDKFFSTLRDPQHPVPCVIPSAISASRRLGQGKVTKGAAEKACMAHHGKNNPNYVELCVRDVLATQDLEVAEAGPGAY